MSAHEALGKSVRDIQARLREHERLLECLREGRGGSLSSCLSFDCRHAALLRETLVEAIEVLEESRKSFKSPRLEALRKKLVRVLVEAA
ncbi:MAG: hypothetical protein A4E73_00528 [Syntrophaceae bacterium PtaU1.Bin231]|jgi:hypothetical protein|nr:MAG: hypothetical protein A4E73_00528 [Syntrophaceae bacterium PtaU1.Bin231]